MDVGVDFHGRVHKGMVRQLAKLLKGKGVLLIEGENLPQRLFAQVLNLASTWSAFRVCGPWASRLRLGNGSTRDMNFAPTPKDARPSQTATTCSNTWYISPEEQVRFHMYRCVDLASLGERQGYMLKSLFTTQDLFHSRLIHTLVGWQPIIWSDRAQVPRPVS
jgi:hypothetical protein